MTHSKAVCLSRARWKIRNILVLACVAAGLSAAAPNAFAIAPAKADNGLYHPAAIDRLGTVPATNITATHDPGAVLNTTKALDPAVMLDNRVTQARACPEGGAASAVDIVAAVATNPSSTANIALGATAPPNDRVPNTNLSDDLGNTNGINSANLTTTAGTIAGMDTTDNFGGTMNNAPNSVTTVELASSVASMHAGAANTS
jgi:hypothetical protein